MPERFALVEPSTSEQPHLYVLRDNKCDKSLKKIRKFYAKEVESFLNISVFYEITKVRKVEHEF